MTYTVCILGKVNNKPINTVGGWVNIYKEMAEYPTLCLSQRYVAIFWIFSQTSGSEEIGP
jgi:hypothetical protein